MEYLPRNRTPQLSCLSSAHFDVEIRFLVDLVRYITFSSCIVCLMLSLSVIINWIVPIPDVMVLPNTPVTPTLGTGLMSIKILLSKQMQWITQLLVPNSVGLLVNEIGESVAAYFPVLSMIRPLLGSSTILVKYIGLVRGLNNNLPEIWKIRLL